jgi:predicted nucleotidyltransferase
MITFAKNQIDMQTSECLSKLRQFKQQYSLEYGIERMGIFGSIARGEQTEESDIDICRQME